eukprot:scaffold186351_cov28-Tisochrysis_lutea.AAC.1
MKSEELLKASESSLHRVKGWSVLVHKVRTPTNQRSERREGSLQQRPQYVKDTAERNSRLPCPRPPSPSLPFEMCCAGGLGPRCVADEEVRTSTCFF